MSVDKRRDQAGRWLATARDDLAAAEKLLQANMFSHVGFLSQQAGEKAVKALHLLLDSDPWGHSLVRLLETLPTADLAHLHDEAVALDKLYIPTRYPDALPGLTPAEAYTRAEAEAALVAAGAFIRAVEPLIAETT